MPQTATSFMKCVETIIEFLPKGSTKPLLALDENGHKKVIKVLYNPKMGKLLLNEFIAGNLATTIGLPSPKISLATLSTNAIEFLKSNSLPPVSKECIAIDFIEDLNPIPWPKPPSGHEEWNINNLSLLPELNRKHLNQYFDNPEKDCTFYGRALYEVWLFLQDTKYDTLFVTQNRTPFFLDYSHAFEGSDWEFEQMDYSLPKCLPLSPYLEGILTDLTLYDEWFVRIETLKDELVHSLIGAIPESWSIKNEELAFLRNLLTSQRSQFISNWRDEINNQKIMKELLNNKE